jgi:ABC-2 type transport system ATP-binding protein
MQGVSEALVLKNLVKKYGSRYALENVSLSIPKGLIFGLLGPNGAGKSTMINIIAGIIKQTSGDVFILGKDTKAHLNECKMLVGTAMQDVLLDPFFTVYEYLTFTAGYYGIYGKKAKTRIEEICSALSLIPHLKKNTRMLSGGMKRRLIVAKAILHDPEIIILDEPTAGVDIELRNSLWDYVLELNKQGKTIILTTHYLEEAQNFCHNLAFINEGKIILNEKTPNVLKTLNSKKISVFLEDGADLSKINLQNATLNNKERLIELTYNPLTFSIDEFLNLINNYGLKVRDVSTKEPTLDDIFLSIFKKHV